VYRQLVSLDPPPSKRVKYLADPHDPEQIELLFDLLREEEPTEGDASEAGETGSSPENG
jgi:hypothetical protein